MTFKTNYYLLAVIVVSICSCTPDIDYSQFKKASSINAKIEGFEIQEIIKGAGEWLSITPDPQGRLIISPRFGLVIRATINNVDGDVQIDTLDIGVTDCQSMLYAYGSLYMMGSNSQKVRGVHRLKDRNGKGDYGPPELLMEFPRNGDHSGHTLTLGPDGLIYFLSGNENKVASGAHVDYVSKDWNMDHPMVLKSFFGVNQLPPGGFVMRTDSAGSFWQLYAYGLRNPYDMCFNAQGELFTWDSDMEWDFNLPWYRPTRVNHLVSGGDYAWRQFNAKRWDYYPDVWPAVKDFGRGSPTGTTFGTGTNFPPKYQKALFLGDWSYGKIYALHLSPDGASYTGDYEVFADGKPLNITDIAVGHDGAIYFVTGGNGTDTGLYRIVWKDKQHPPNSVEAPHPFVNLRKKLESYHFSTDTTGLGLAMSMIAHEDRFVRNAARVILERNEPRLWHQLTKTQRSTDGLIASMVALIRADTLHQYTEDISSLVMEFDYSTLNENERLAYLRLIALFVLRDETITTTTKVNLQSKLNPFYPADSQILNKELSRTLAFLTTHTRNDMGMVHQTMKLAEQAVEQLELIHYLEILRLVEDGWTDDLRLAYRHWVDYAGKNLRGGSLFQYFISEIREDFESRMPNAVKRKLSKSAPKTLTNQYTGPFQNEIVSRKVEGQSFEFVKNWQFDDLEYSLEMVNSPRGQSHRNWNRGYQMLEKGQCYNCHSMLGRGGSFGPEITLAGNSFNAGDLLTTILEPSKTINARFHATQFNLKNDDIAIGRLLNESESHYVIQSDWTGENIEEIPKDAVSGTESGKISEMPPALLNTMNRDEILDLLYFITEIPAKIDDVFAFDIMTSQKYTTVGDSVFTEILNYSGQGKVYYALDGDDYQIYSNPFYLDRSTTISAFKSLHGQNTDTSSQFVHFYTPDKNGVRYEIYASIQNPFSTKTKKPDQIGVTPTFDIADIAQDMDNFEVHMRSQLMIETSGEYTISSDFNDGVQIFIDNQLIINEVDNNWGGSASATIKLRKGLHSMKVIFYDRLSSEYLEIRYGLTGQDSHIIPADKLMI